MADFKYIMQGFQKDINFFDEIKEVLETEDYTSIWILTAFVNERAICNLMPSIKKSKADISFIIGIRNNVSTYQALKCLINMKVSVFVFDTARIESIFHARSTEFSDENSVLDLVNSIILAVDEDIDNSEKKITDKKEFYDYLYGLEYVGVSFKLKMGGRDLEELSPGERGIVLLIFYLALSQNSIPIIIDQPEDNLDNQSVYNKLVPCICAAKQKRQVIIVTHNPNIAVACDAEQIICCKMDKNTHKITYLSGAIEDQEIKQNVVDILEGTMPAFDLRRRKYV